MTEDKVQVLNASVGGDAEYQDLANLTEILREAGYKVEQKPNVGELKVIRQLDNEKIKQPKDVVKEAVQTRDGNEPKDVEQVSGTEDESSECCDYDITENGIKIHQDGCPVLNDARKEEVKGKGRPPSLTEEQREEVVNLYRTEDYTYRELASKFNVSAATVSDLINERVEENSEESDTDNTSSKSDNSDKAKKEIKPLIQVKEGGIYVCAECSSKFEKHAEARNHAREEGHSEKWLRMSKGIPDSWKNQETIDKIVDQAMEAETANV